MFRKGLRLLVFAVLGTGFVLSQGLPDGSRSRQPAKKRPSASKQVVKTDSPPASLPIPNDGVILAWEDIQTLSPFVQPFIRYLFIADMDKDSMRTSSLALNYISRADRILRPQPIANGLLIRVDLRCWAPRENDLIEWLKFWEELAFDPTFSLLITKDNIKFANIDPKEIPTEKTLKPTIKKAIRIPTKSTIRKKIRDAFTENLIVNHPGGKYVYPDDSGRVVKDIRPGKYEVELRWKTKFQDVEVEELVDKGIEELIDVASSEVDVIRVNSRAIDSKPYQGLQIATGSLAPIVEHRYFKGRVLKTIKDDGIFKQIFGGLYYEFKGVKTAKDVFGKDTKVSDLDVFFESLGIGNIKGGLDADALFDRLRSDDGSVLFRSEVTGKPRDIWLFNVPAARGFAKGSITGDIKDKSIDIGDRAFANLLTPRRDAREAIFPVANGLLLFGLFDGKGKRQDEVPPDIANDYTIPRPHTQRLDIFGCITCHSMIGKDGWQPMKNDVKVLLSGKLDIFGDRSVRDKIQPDIIDRIAGKYTGDFTRDLMRMQDDVAEATLKATGPWKTSEDQTDVCKLSAQRIFDEYNSYFWVAVDAQIALREIGLDVSKDQALRVFRQVVPPDLRASAFGIVLEDPRIAALAEGLSINRYDFAFVYSNIADRARRNPIYNKLRGVR